MIPLWCHQPSLVQPEIAQSMCKCSTRNTGIQNFQGMSTSVTVAVDADNDTFLDSVLASSDLQL